MRRGTTAVSIGRNAGGSATVRCQRCRDTGLVSDGWNKDVASAAIPCPCIARVEADARDYAACRLELAVGIPIAIAAGGLLYWFA